jgi:hypothetical protein
MTPPRDLLLVDRSKLSARQARAAKHCIGGKMADIDALVDQLTLEEKATLTAGGSGSPWWR